MACPDVHKTPCLISIPRAKCNKTTGSRFHARTGPAATAGSELAGPCSQQSWKMFFRTNLGHTTAFPVDGRKHLTVDELTRFLAAAAARIEGFGFSCVTPPGRSASVSGPIASPGNAGHAVSGPSRKRGRPVSLDRCGISLIYFRCMLRDSCPVLVNDIRL